MATTTEEPRFESRGRQREAIQFLIRLNVCCSPLGAPIIKHPRATSAQRKLLTVFSSAEKCIFTRFRLGSPLSLSLFYLLLPAIFPCSPSLDLRGFIRYSFYLLFIRFVNPIAGSAVDINLGISVRGKCFIKLNKISRLI